MDVASPVAALYAEEEVYVLALADGVEHVACSPDYGFYGRPVDVGLVGKEELEVAAVTEGDGVHYAQVASHEERRVVG